MEEDQEGQWRLSAIPWKTCLPLAAQWKVIHATIKKVTEDIDALAFNTAISQMMVCTNELVGAATRPLVAFASSCLTVAQPLCAAS